MKYIIKLSPTKRRQRVQGFFVAGIALSIIVSLAGILLGSPSMYFAHADTRQITEDIIECAIYNNGTAFDGGEQSSSAWNIINGNENIITSGGKTFPINGYKGQRGVTVSGSQQAGSPTTDTLSGSNQCDGYFLAGWDQQQNAWRWTYTFHNKPNTDLCTASVYIPSWDAGATKAEYTLGNSLQQITTATLDQNRVNGAFTTPQWKGQYAKGIPIGTDTGQGDVTLELDVKSGGSANYLAADAVDFHCTMPVTNSSSSQPGSTSTPLPTSTSTSAPTATPTETPRLTPTNTPVATTPSSTPTPGNLVTNGSFEMGSPAPSNWMCNSGAAVVSSLAHSGERALQETEDNSTFSTVGQCTQTIKVQPNHSYTLTIYVAGMDPHNSYIFLGANDNSANWTTRSGASTWKTNLSTSYTRLSVPFTTRASQTSITIFVDGWNVDVDDVFAN